MFLLRKRKMILNFGKMLDIMPKFDIITVAFQRQQVPHKSCRGCSQTALSLWEGLSLRLLHVPVSFGAGTFSLVPILIVEVKQLYA